MPANCNPILNTDSYKASHYLQYPPGTEKISCYVESRGGEFEKIVFFGLQMFLLDYLTKPITKQYIAEAEEFFTDHGLSFNRQGWEYILKNHNGFLPLYIEAIPEGSVIPYQNVLLQVVNTDPHCFWLTTYVETSLLRSIWYPTTVATLSWHCKAIIRRYLLETAENLDSLPFQLHDFGARGVSSYESARLGGAAHLVSFKGTDTISGIIAARNYYFASMAGTSIPAAEHSTITAWGKDQEKDAYANMIKQFSGENKLVAVVSDSYDLWHALEHIWGEELKEQVINNGGTIIIRPDSGNPAKIVTRTINILCEKFGFQENSKGYRVLPSFIRVIQGDSVNIETIEECLRKMKEEKQSAENIAFGMGGALLQKLNRDTLEFAMKANAILRDGKWHDVYKDPVTGSGKKSKPGRLALIQNENKNFQTVRLDELNNRKNLLIPLFRNGKILQQWHFDEIREKANQALL